MLSEQVSERMAQVSCWRDRRVPVRCDPTDHSQVLLDGTLYAAIGQRRAVRAFTDAPVTPETLGQLVVAADAATRMVAPEMTHLVSVNVVAARVTTTPPGLYHIEPGGGLQAGPALRGTFAELVNQDHFAGAAAILLFAGDAAGAERELGTVGYLRLLVAAGAAGHAAWLRAVAEGLAGCLFNGVQSECLPAGWGEDWQRHHLLALAVGQAADA